MRKLSHKDYVTISGDITVFDQISRCVLRALLGFYIRFSRASACSRTRASLSSAVRGTEEDDVLMFKYVYWDAPFAKNAFSIFKMKHHLRRKLNKVRLLINVAAAASGPYSSHQTSNYTTL